MEAILILLVLSNFGLLAFFGVKSIKDYYYEKEKKTKGLKVKYDEVLKRHWALDQEKIKEFWDKYPIPTDKHAINVFRDKINNIDKIVPERDTFDVNQFKS